jgi:hypothetical protein
MKRRERACLKAQWEGSVTQCSGVTTSVGVEAAPRKGKGGNDTNWGDANLAESKNEENPRDRFSWYKWTVKI